MGFVLNLEEHTILLHSKHSKLHCTYVPVELMMNIIVIECERLYSAPRGAPAAERLIIAGRSMNSMIESRYAEKV